MKSAAGFYITRGLIGLLEGAFGPLTVVCLSNFYTDKELGFRIAILSSEINVSLLLHH
jgi:MFS family permease